MARRSGRPVTMINEFSKYENEFHAWARDGYPGAKDETIDYIQHLTHPHDDSKPRNGTLWEHQWDSFLRAIYSYEIKRNDLSLPNGILLNIVTGGGKTAIIAALMAWLKHAHNTQKFLIICPNLIVRDRLEDDFQNGKVFVDRDLISPNSNFTKDDFALTVLGGDRESGLSSLLGADVILGNIHQFYTSNRSGQSNLASLMNGANFALFNDEAHNSPAAEWDATLQKMEPKITLRVDTTATPDRADLKTPESNMIYEYGIQDALADRLIKTPVVYQPNIETVELTYTDAMTGEKRGVEEIDWAEVDRAGLSATQWVTDEKPMQQQMAIALQRLREQERRAMGRYQPILFVVAVSKFDAERATKTLNQHFNIKTLQATEDSSDADRRRATELGKARRPGTPYRAVVSVLMLREGWDVPEVGVVLLLRKFGSPVYAQQVIGRGLRRVRISAVKEDEPQICAVVDHPKLEHGWLWKMFGSKIRHDVGIDDKFDEHEDLPPPPPRQELTDPAKLITIPEPVNDDDGVFDLDGMPVENHLPIENWREALESMAYPSDTVEISDQNITGVEKRVLDQEGWKDIQSAPDEEEDAANGDIQMPPEDLAEAIKEELMNIAERLLEHAGHSNQFKGQIYRILLEHIRTKFLEGASLGLAEEPQLEATWRSLHAIENNIADKQGLVEGMVKHGDK